MVNSKTSPMDLIKNLDLNILILCNTIRIPKRVIPTLPSYCVLVTHCKRKDKVFCCEEGKKNRETIKEGVVETCGQLCGIVLHKEYNCKSAYFLRVIRF